MIMSDYDYNYNIILIMIILGSFQKYLRGTRDWTSATPVTNFSTFVVNLRYLH